MSKEIREGFKTELKKYVKNADELEEQIHKKSKDADDYNRKIVIILEFLSPDSVLGQFSKFFQTKVEHEIYTPERIAELEIEEIFPEVFLKDDVSLQNDVKNYLDSIVSEYTANIGMGHKKTKPAKQVFIPLKKIKDIKTICYNAFWDAPLATTVICKDKGRFYCLSAKNILEQAEEGVAVNPYTNNPIDIHIVDKLRRRYKNVFNVQRTSTEITELKHVLERLNILNNSLSGKITLENAVKRYEDVIPPYVKDMVSATDDDEYNPEIITTKKQLQLRVERMIKDIEEIIEGAEPEKEKIKLEIVEESETESEESEQEQEQKPEKIIDKTQEKDLRKFQKWLKLNEVLTPFTQDQIDIFRSLTTKQRDAIKSLSFTNIEKWKGFSDEQKKVMRKVPKETVEFFKKLPTETILRFKNLSEKDIDDLEVTTLTLDQLRNLKILDIQNKDIKLPKYVRALKNLERMDLINTGLKTLPELNPKLKVLNLHDNVFTDVPENIKKLNLDTLILTKNNIEKLPVWLGEKRLNIYIDDDVKVPKSVEKNIVRKKVPPKPKKVEKPVAKPQIPLLEELQKLAKQTGDINIEGKIELREKYRELADIKKKIRELEQAPDVSKNEGLKTDLANELKKLKDAQKEYAEKKDKDILKQMKKHILKVQDLEVQIKIQKESEMKLGKKGDASKAMDLLELNKQLKRKLREIKYMKDIDPETQAEKILGEELGFEGEFGDVAIDDDEGEAGELDYPEEQEQDEDEGEVEGEEEGFQREIVYTGEAGDEREFADMPDSNSTVKQIYNDYMLSLISLRDVLSELKTDESRKLLENVQKQIDNLEDMIKTPEGVRKILESRKKYLEELIEKQKVSGIELVYPGPASSYSHLQKQLQLINEELE